jgi:DNA-directed RNA polymerase subunit beta'
VSTPIEIWRELQNSATNAVKETFPIEGQQRRLVLNSVSVDDKSAQYGDIRSQEKAKEMSRTWGANVVADLSLVDKKSGKVIDRTKMKLFTLPKPTERYGYIVDGNEYQVDYLWRLKPGVYSQIKANAELETEFALSKPFARESRLKIPFNPENRKFKFRIGDKNVGLYPVLKMLGVQDEEMKKVWGDEIYNANSTSKIEQDIRQLYTRASRRGVKAKGDSYDDIASALVGEFYNTELSPETTKVTLGKPLQRVDGEALLLASKRVLDVARGVTPPDDRNSLIFKRLSGVEDFLQERITRPSTKRSIQAKVGNNIDRQDSIRDIIPGALFTKPVNQLFTSSSLSKNPEQTNPLEMLSNFRSTTVLGGDEGGIKNEQTLIRDMKLINPSHMGFLDPIHTPESKRTGISLNLPLGVTKDGQEAKTIVYDLKSNKTLSGKDGITPAQLHSEYVLLPDQVTWEKGKPKPIADLVKMKDPATGDIVSRPFKDAKYLFTSPHQLFDEATNLIPFLQNNQGNRTMTAARQALQAVGLKQREQPLVQVQGGDETWEKIIGKPFTHTSPINGEVVEIKTNQTDNSYPDAIVIKDWKGKKHEVQLYNHFPLNESKSFMTSIPLVKPGDKVKADQTIADTNFTKDGSLAIGTNLKVSYLPYKGYNFEDGIVISDSASKKLTSEHVYRHSVEIDPAKDKMDKKSFQVYASATSKQYNKDQLNKLGDDGIIRVGTKVDPGDILIAAVGKKQNLGSISRMASRLDKSLFEWDDRSVKWESPYPGEVVKVQKLPGGKGAMVHVRTDEPAEVGDKIVGRHGNKSIITQIIPDSEMPRIGGPDGPHTEVLMNPSGVPSRINLGQMLETAASKIAKTTGKPYVVDNFGGANKDYTQQIKDDLKSLGLSDTEKIFDPNTKKALGDVLTGDQYIMKLKHQVDKKLAVRGAGSGLSYSIDRAPKGTGAENPGQAIGQLEFYSLLAHGARKNLKEMATYKADQQLDESLNPQAHIDFWHRVQFGQPIPAPKPTFAYKKFEGYLKGLGIDTKKTGNQLQLVPLTDKGVLALSNGEIKDPGRVLRGKDAKELEKGLFDPQITGGLPDPNEPGKGLKWSHIHLAEPMPNPVFVGTPQKPGPAVVLTGLKFQEFEDVVKGKKQIDGKTGGEAIKHLLDKIDVKKDLEDLRKELPNLRESKLNHANRKAKYLRALDNLKMKPSEAYIMNEVPVLPPVFRPIVPMPDGSLRFDDINHLYKSLGIVNNKLKDQIKDLPESDQPLREEMWDILKASMGTGSIPQYESNRELRGILDTIAGPNPKQGFFQNRIMKRRQDLSMRSTIIPEPAMHLDYVGIPKSAALELYKPFVLRELHKTGKSRLQAIKDLKEETPAAWSALENVVEERPILLKRDPALHKYSFMAFKPKLVDGKAIRIHPLVTAGYNADFDGDTMSAFVPLTDDAVRESYKMFPSNNLFSSTNAGIMHAPDQESLLGLHLLSKWGEKSNKTFSTYEQARKAYDQGKLSPNEVIKVGGKDTTLGRLMIAKQLPREFSKMGDLLHNSDVVIAKRSGEGKLGLHDILTEIAKKNPKDYANTVDRLKDIGNDYSYQAGFSISLNDLGVNKEVRDQVLSKADREASKILNSPIPDKDKKLVDVYDKATKELEDKLKHTFKNNNLFTMVDSGARGKWSQFRQMNIAPMLMQDASGKVIPNPVRKSYSEGLDVGDYWTALHGARMGTLQRAEGTSEPGRLTKEIINLVIPELVSNKECGSSDGVAMSIGEDDVHDRYLAKPISVGGRTLGRNTLVTPDITAQLKKNKVDRIVVRSPLKCTNPNGICAKCYGLNENGREHEIGTNIGVIAGHSLGEPAMQLAMDSFHTGGVASSRGAGATTRIGRLNQLIGLPAKLPDAATLAQASGKVDKIEIDEATKGWNIYIGNQKHYAPSMKKLMLKGEEPLKPGMTVRKGDPLTDGPINPRDLLKLTDVPTVQNYLVDELYDGIYKDERVRRRNIETVVRSLTNLTRVRDPGDSEYLPGDIVLRTVVEQQNRDLKKAGQNPISDRPVLKGMRQSILDHQEDWMARLNFQRLKESLMEGAAKGWSTNLHGPNPIPSYAFGAEFGEGTSKDPWKY